MQLGVWRIIKFHSLSIKVESKTKYEPLGVIVVRQWRQYHKGILAKLRENAGCLLMMFFECEGAEAVLESLFLQVEGGQKVSTTTILVWTRIM